MKPADGPTTAAASAADAGGLLPSLAASWKKVHPDALPTAAFIAASRELAPIYDVFFGGGKMGSMLKHDLVNHTDQVEAMSTRHPERERQRAGGAACCSRRHANARIHRATGRPHPH